MFRLLLFTYVLGGLTFVPLLLAGWVYLWFVSSSPVGDADPEKIKKEALSEASAGLTEKPPPSVDVPNQKPIQGWVTARRTFEEPPSESSYAVSMMRNFLDSRSGDPKRLRPKDTYYAVLKSNVLYLYEDDSQNECFAAIGLASYEVLISPDVVLDAELFAKRNGIMLREIPPTPSPVSEKKGFPSLSKDMKISGSDDGEKSSTEGATSEETAAAAAEKKALRRKERAAIRRNSTFNLAKPWFLFVKSNTQMEDWYLALLHASTQPMATPPLLPLLPVFSTNDMAQFVSSIDNQSDPIPMRWLNALIGRLFFSLYKTSHLEKYIIGRIVRKISKIQLPGFLSDVTAKEVSVGTTAPMFNKPMLKELTKEGDASVEVGLSYKGEVRITIEAKANINIGIKNYTVDLVVAVVLREIEGNLLIKIKRPPSNRIWYAFTHQPKIELEVEPVVADRSIKWSLILNPITTKIKEAIQDSVVLPNMDDIPFFETAPYEHRGGIFADAVRKSALSSDPTNGAPNGHTTPETSPIPSSPVDPKKSQSVDALPSQVQVETSPSAATSTLELPPPMARSDSMPDASKASADTTLLPHLHGAGTTIKDNDFDRGRQEQRVTNANMKVSSDMRSGSVPAPERKERESTPESQSSSSGSTNSATDSSEPINGALNSKSTTTGPPSPTLSRKRSGTISHSSSKSLAHADFSSITSSTTSEASQLSKSTNSTPLSNSTSSTSQANTPTTPSFLSALKRGTDKQGLANTAKDTFKKWNAGWNALRGVDSDLDESSRDSDRGGSDKESDPKKKSYAEMRAEVSARRSPRPGSPGSPPSTTGNTVANGQKSPTRPTVRPRTNSAILTELQNSGAIGFSGGARSPPKPRQLSISGVGVGGVRPPQLPPRFSTPSAAKATTELQTSISTELRPEASLAVGHDSLTPLLVDPPTPLPIPAPIYKQPSSGAKMMIPGIHASHKGEVMALGSPALPTPLELPKPAAVGVGAATAGIQNVYSLFKKPTTTTDSGATRSQPALGLLNANANANANSNGRPVPAPPLPHTNSQPTILPSTEPDLLTPRLHSAASEALKQLALLDMAARSTSGDSTPSHRSSTSPSKRNSMIDDSDFESSAEVGMASPLDGVTHVQEQLPKPNPPPLPPRRSSTAASAAVAPVL